VFHPGGQKVGELRETIVSRILEACAVDGGKRMQEFD
jgi:hypothetical protein